MKNLNRLGLNRYNLIFRNLLVPVILPHNSRIILKMKILNVCHWESRLKSWVIFDDRRSLNTIISLFYDEEQNSYRKNLKSIYYNIYREVFIMIRELSAREEARKRVKSFVYYTIEFLLKTGKQPLALDDSDADKYINFLHREKRIISEEVQAAVDALNFFFREVLRKDIQVYCPLPGPSNRKISKYANLKAEAEFFMKVS